jgi:predicted transport protein
MPVFREYAGDAKQLAPDAFQNEKALQQFFEANLQTLLGVRFVATEFSTGLKHGGRIDTLGFDEDGNPVIIEYKWDKSDSVINQGLFYLAWLVDHRGDFEIAARKALGNDIHVSWQSPRLIIVASSYTKYDLFAVTQLPAGIELLRYQRYAEGIVVLDNAVEPLESQPKKSLPVNSMSPTFPPATTGATVYDLDYHLSRTADALLREALLELRDMILALDGVEERLNQKSQITYRTTKSFAAIDVQKSYARVQFKGPKQLNPVLDPLHLAEDILSYQWGYPWLAKLHTPQDVEPVFTLVRAAYEHEQ